MLFNEAHLTPALYLVLSTVIELLTADKGSIRFYDKKNGMLTIAAHIGFSDNFLSRLESVKPGQAACGEALRRKERVIIEDVTNHPLYVHMGPTFMIYGYYAVQATPLLDSSGKVFGVLTTHFKKPHRPTEYELKTLDEYLRKAVPLIDQKRRV